MRWMQRGRDILDWEMARDVVKITVRISVFEQARYQIWRWGGFAFFRCAVYQCILDINVESRHTGGFSRGRGR